MKASDYIVTYIIEQGITDVFGYPGGMVTHLMDSFHKYTAKINAHVTYHEQGAAFAACGYAQASGKIGVAYATSGPGATNLITGICHAYFDSIPTVFITGQVNTFESKDSLPIRQRGFQETDIISMVKPVTKYAVYVHDTDDLKIQLEKAFQIANSGRKGPVLLDIPMDVQQGEVTDKELLKPIQPTTTSVIDFKEREHVRDNLKKALQIAKRPCFLLGNGVKMAGLQDKAKAISHKFGLPVVSSMISVDVLAGSSNTFGFVGAYGNRTANFIIAKSDLVITIGSRMDIRQVGAKRENFAPAAQILRFDIDVGELSYSVHGDEIHFTLDAETVFDLLNDIQLCNDYSNWMGTCQKIQEKLKGIDDKIPNILVKTISKEVPANAIITTDVGQNQVWVAQSFLLKEGQKILFSGGHGAMGFSLPAAIGAAYAQSDGPVICFSGDGGFQMNIQELQLIAREKLPVKMIVLNNNALGMIRHFQEMYFGQRYFQTKPEGGYTAPDFTRIADAYGIRSQKITDVKDVVTLRKTLIDDQPLLIEVDIQGNTYVSPKLRFGEPNQDQEPLLDRKLYNEIMEL